MDQALVVRALFDAATPNAPMLDALLEGRVPGEVLVDEPVNPAVAVAMLRYHGITFASVGAPPEFLGRALRGRGPALLVAGEAAPGEAIERVEFTVRRPTSNRGRPAEAEVRLLRSVDLPRCRWHGEVLAACGSAEDFERHGMGVAVWVGGTLAAEAYACFIGGGRAELGVVTHPSYRGRGLARAACSALIERCEARGLTASWSCAADNAGSIATAAAIGFVEPRAYRFVRLGSTPAPPASSAGPRAS